MEICGEPALPPLDVGVGCFGSKAAPDEARIGEHDFSRELVQLDIGSCQISQSVGRAMEQRDDELRQVDEILRRRAIARRRYQPVDRLACRTFDVREESLDPIVERPIIQLRPIEVTPGCLVARVGYARVTSGPL